MRLMLRSSLLVFGLVWIMTIHVTAQVSRQRVIFFGDSITELGVKPDGYITQLQSLIDNSRRGNGYELIGAGVSGNKIYDLYLRLDTDVLKRSPNVVVIFIGVNDVWHKRLLGTGTDLDKFGRFYEAIVDKLKAANSKLIFCTPAVIGERRDETNEMDGELNLYSQWIRDLAARNNIPLVDLRKLFHQYEIDHNTENKSSGILTTDKVHLNKTGNQLVAGEMWLVLQTL
jgi:lysophospholipase L1-like esterase